MTQDWKEAAEKYANSFEIHLTGEEKNLIAQDYLAGAEHACEQLKQQLSDMTWEYENACKFATQFEQQRDKLKAEVESYKKAAHEWEMNWASEREANEKLREALEVITDDSWYKNGFVSADDEQARRAILMNRLNEVRKIAKQALHAAKQDDTN